MKTANELRQRLRQMSRLFKLGIPKAEIARRYGISRQRAHQLLGKRERAT